MKQEIETRIRIVRKEVTPGRTVEKVGWDYQIPVDFVLENGMRIPSRIKRRTKREIMIEFRKLPMEIHHLDAIFVNGTFRCNDFVLAASNQ